MRARDNIPILFNISKPFNSRIRFDRYRAPVFQRSNEIYHRCEACRAAFSKENHSEVRNNRRVTRPFAPIGAPLSEPEMKRKAAGLRGEKKKVATFPPCAGNKRAGNVHVIAAVERTTQKSSRIPAVNIQHRSATHGSRYAAVSPRVLYDSAFFAEFSPDAPATSYSALLAMLFNRRRGINAKDDG